MKSWKATLTLATLSLGLASPTSFSAPEALIQFSDDLSNSESFPIDLIAQESTRYKVVAKPEPYKPPKPAPPGPLDLPGKTSPSPKPTYGINPFTTPISIEVTTPATTVTTTSTTTTATTTTASTTSRPRIRGSSSKQKKRLLLRKVKRRRKHKHRKNNSKVTKSLVKENDEEDFIKLVSHESDNGYFGDKKQVNPKNARAIPFKQNRPSPTYSPNKSYRQPIQRIPSQRTDSNAQTFSPKPTYQQARPAPRYKSAPKPSPSYQPTQTPNFHSPSPSPGPGPTHSPGYHSPSPSPNYTPTNYPPTPSPTYKPPPKGAYKAPRPSPGYAQNHPTSSPKTTRAPAYHSPTPSPYNPSPGYSTPSPAYQPSTRRPTHAPSPHTTIYPPSSPKPPRGSIPLAQRIEQVHREEDYGDDKEKRPYSFNYGVNDPKTGADFYQAEERSGPVTRGSYKVALPDGRIQIVTYMADDNGYHASVSYEGEPKYPSPDEYKTQHFSAIKDHGLLDVSPYSPESPPVSYTPSDSYSNYSPSSPSTTARPPLQYSPSSEPAVFPASGPAVRGYSTPAPPDSQSPYTLSSPAPIPYSHSTPEPSYYSSSTPEPSYYSPSTPSPRPYSPSTPEPSYYSPSTPSPSPYSPSTPEPSYYSPSTPAPSPYSPSTPEPDYYSPSTPSPATYSPSSNAYSPSSAAPVSYSPFTRASTPAPYSPSSPASISPYSPSTPAPPRRYSPSNSVPTSFGPSSPTPAPYSPSSPVYSSSSPSPYPAVSSTPSPLPAHLGPHPYSVRPFADSSIDLSPNKHRPRSIEAQGDYDGVQNQVSTTTTNTTTTTRRPFTSTLLPLVTKSREKNTNPTFPSKILELIAKKSKSPIKKIENDKEAEDDERYPVFGVRKSDPEEDPDVRNKKDLPKYQHFKPAPDHEIPYGTKSLPRPKPRELGKQKTKLSLIKNPKVDKTTTTTTTIKSVQPTRSYFGPHDPNSVFTTTTKRPETKISFVPPYKDKYVEPTTFRPKLTREMRQAFSKNVQKRHSNFGEEKEDNKNVEQVQS